MDLVTNGFWRPLIRNRSTSWMRGKFVKADLGRKSDSLTTRCQLYQHTLIVEGSSEVKFYHRYRGIIGRLSSLYSRSLGVR